MERGGGAGEGNLHSRGGWKRQDRERTKEQATLPTTWCICAPYLSQGTCSPAPRMGRIEKCARCAFKMNQGSLLLKRIPGQTALMETQQGLPHFKTFGPALPARRLGPTCLLSSLGPLLSLGGSAPTPFPGRQSQPKQFISPSPPTHIL